MPLSDTELSKNQQKALLDQIRLIEACPGAGKTRAIVERFRQNAVNSGAGVALLSFTNAAIDEVTMRCVQFPDVLRPPHFVGTLDSFLHRYVVTPFDTSVNGAAPRFMQSWDEMPSASRSLKVGRYPYQLVRLSNFSHDENGVLEFRIEGLSGDDKRFYNSATAVEQNDFVRKGIERITKHNRDGLYDSDSARYRALEILRSAKSESLRRSLVKRFSEIIVDEFQDCAGVEHGLLNLLSSLGISVTAVADPDQAIYGFRQAEHRLYEQYKSKLGEEELLRFDTNYRSTAAICSFVSSLRFHGDSEIVSGRKLGDAEDPANVYLLAGSDQAVRTRFVELANQWDVPGGQRFVLAHRSKDARKLASGASELGVSDSSTTNLMRHMTVLISSGSALARKKACAAIEALFMNSLDWHFGEKQLPVSEKLEIVGKDSRWVRMVVGQLLSAADLWIDETGAGVSIRTILKPQLTELPRQFDGAFSSKFAKPRVEVWEHWIQAKNLKSTPEKLAWSTIHGSKGREYDAVLLKAPGADVFTSWGTNQASEGRRVFYVGASRARRLLVIAVAKTRFTTVKKQLEAKGLLIEAERLS